VTEGIILTPWGRGVGWCTKKVRTDVIVKKGFSPEPKKDAVEERCLSLPGSGIFSHRALIEPDTCM